MGRKEPIRKNAPPPSPPSSLDDALERGEASLPIATHARRTRTVSPPSPSPSPSPPTIPTSASTPVHGTLANLLHRLRPSKPTPPPASSPTFPASTSTPSPPSPPQLRPTARARRVAGSRQPPAPSPDETDDMIEIELSQLHVEPPASPSSSSSTSAASLPTTPTIPTDKSEPDETRMARETATFHTHVATVREELVKLKTELALLKNEQSDALRSLDTQETAHHHDTMCQEIARVSRLALSCRQHLEELHRTNVTLAAEMGLAKRYPAHIRMREVIIQQLRSRLRDTMRDFNEFRSRVQREHRETVERRLRVVLGRDAATAEVDRVLDAGEADQIFRQALLQASRVGAEATLYEVRARHQSFLQLERCMLELHQLYLDTATLVDGQGEQLDSIEAQVAKAAEYTEQGTGALRETKRLFKRLQKKKLIAIGICVIVVIVGVLGLVLGLVGATKK